MCHDNVASPCLISCIECFDKDRILFCDPFLSKKFFTYRSKGQHLDTMNKFNVTTKPCCIINLGRPEDANYFIGIEGLWINVIGRCYLPILLSTSYFCSKSQSTNVTHSVI